MSLESQVAAYSTIPLWLIAIALIWSLAWKGLALWKSARKNHLVWFIMLLVVNTLGILEILYIFLFSKIKLDDDKPKKSKRTNSKSPKKRKR